MLPTAMLCLQRDTDPRWVAAAVEHLDELLADHAHCEMKAASSALSLAARVPDRPTLARALAELAREEIDHYVRVLDELGRRGVTLGPPPVDAYAVELRKLANTTAGSPHRPEHALVDRLLVGALIEARSCERFRLLIDALRTRGVADLADFYEELLAAEARHYRTFVDLAIEVAAGDEPSVRARLERLSAGEALICARLDNAPVVHG